MCHLYLAVIKLQLYEAAEDGHTFVAFLHRALQISEEAADVQTAWHQQGQGQDL